MNKERCHSLWFSEGKCLGEGHSDGEWCNPFLVTLLAAYIILKQNSVTTCTHSSITPSLRDTAKHSETPLFTLWMCTCLPSLCAFFPTTTDFPPPCMSRWTYDAIIHGHSQVFIIRRALTVKPPGAAFLSRHPVPSYSTVHKMRNINQRREAIIQWQMKTHRINPPNNP